jgi:hypothetical protein
MATHGFRGEGLPSIASVSHLVLRTAEAGAPGGTEVEVRHGRLVHARDTGHPRGTTVEVSDLFGAVPARRKFLRAESTEAGHVAEALTLLALGRPDVGFTLASGGRNLIQAPPVDGLFARVHQVFGATYADDLVPVEGGQAWVTVRGFARPPSSAAARPSQRLFVNGRAVRDRAIARAVTEAYRATGVRDPRAGGAAVRGRAPAHGRRQRASREDGGALRGGAHGVVRGRAGGAAGPGRGRAVRPRASRSPRTRRTSAPAATPPPGPVPPSGLAGRGRGVADGADGGGGRPPPAPCWKPRRRPSSASTATPTSWSRTART